MKQRVAIVSLAPVEFELPPALLLPLRDTLLHLYSGSAETLSWSMHRLLDRQTEVSEVDEARVRLGQVAAVLDQVGWHDDEIVAAGTIDAPRDVLLDAVQGALLDVRDRLARLSTARQDHEALARGRELSFQVYEFQELLHALRTPSVRVAGGIDVGPTDSEGCSKPF